MAKESEGQEKTEQATPKKLKEGRDEGQVAKSMEINSFAIFTSGLLLLYITQQFLSSQMSTMSKHLFNNLDTLSINVNTIQEFAKTGFFFFIITIAPVFFGLFIIAFVASASQTGINFSAKALAPKFNKLNPFENIKNIFFSSSSLVELSKSLLKLIAVGGFAFLVIKDLVKTSTSLMGLTIEEIVNFMIQSALSFLIKISLVYAVIAAIDFIFQKHKFKQEMMMTKQEVKEEHKQTDGDPLIKSRIKRQQFQMAKNRMMKDVPKADVIITNPTHYAIAIKYDIQKDGAPKVVAKGVDLVAQRIKEIAIEYNIPMHEDRQLARALYKMCEIGDQIPHSLFQAVAQVLAYVYKLRDESKRRSII